MFVGMTPVRISFAGGGTDMPEYYEKYGGSVISTNINKFTYVVINLKSDNSFQAFSSDFETHHKKTNYSSLEPKHGTEIPISIVKYFKYKQGGDFLICSDVPPGSGLGASSALSVNCINTITSLMKKKLSKRQIAEIAFHIERNILKHPIGKQDNYVASFGGFNYIKFKKNKVQVTPIKIKKSTLSELEQNLLLFFVGDTRKNSNVLSKQLKNTKQGNKNTIESLHTANDLVDEFYNKLKSSDLISVGELLDKGWTAKKQFAKGVTNNKIDLIYESAIKCGAIGGKLTGAGAGGHLLLYCEKPKQKTVLKKMKNLGLELIPFNFHLSGPKILNLYNYNK
jgi:D-glycero-alpha-D-manno-heptose-7-phosphate kinase|tara:strand:+ start:12313 stop:13329 length:1017 start_codon:yes stop_codon:yes gene_type:complete